MVRKFGKGKSTTGKSFRKSQAWRYLSRRDNADNFEGRTVLVGGKGLDKKDLQGGQTVPDNDKRRKKNKEAEDELQAHFVGNAIKSSKYTIWTFIPRNLFEQFRRVANLYFLIQGTIQLLMDWIPTVSDSPVSPFTSVAPLVFVVLTTMIKQGYEDFKRHRADRGINHRLITKLENGGVREIKSQEINVGDILCLEDGDEFPCDLVLLATSNTNGKASISTANLDGETNLKNQIAPSLTRNYRSDELQNLKAQIECENPNPDLQGFVGRMKIEEVFSVQYIRQPSRRALQPEAATLQQNDFRTIALGPENIVLRGTKLKNTDSIYGCAVYTGPDTKMSQNSQKKGNKFSSIEVSMNKYLLMFMLLLSAEIILSVTLKYTCAIDKPGSQKAWYLDETVDDGEKSIALHVFEDVLSFLVLYNYIIPISLYVTLEFQKFAGSFLLAWDLQLYDEATDQPAKCNTSDLNEELGQVEYLFSDKTGTLTENIMVFKECSIGGVTFRDQMENLVCTEVVPSKVNERSVRKFLEVLALCHTVQASRKVTANKSKNPLDLIYSAASPDEKAIVEACRNYGVAFLGEKEKHGTYWYKLLTSRSSRVHKTTYERLHVLEFDSNRKCMSVILRDSNGNIRLVCKGAESSILPKCKKNTAVDAKGLLLDFSEITMEHINDFATRGLRTLAAAVKTMDPNEYDSFKHKFEEASQALDRREQRIKQVYDEVEDNLELIGAIGIEDKLQENVKETLVALGDAGIKVWILTGDKKETAINISSSCGHFLPDMTMIDVAGLHRADTGRVLYEKLEQCAESKGFGDKILIVDGKTLLTVFGKKDLIQMLRNLTSECRSVICCRMSPLQKAEIVQMIKQSPSKPVTAAVGDGANDVAMIQEAHVGLGIAGKEGRAAVRSSDYAFAKFKHLQRVLLVHGHWYYYRAANLVQYFFFKNVACFTAQLYFAFFNSFSTQTLFDEVSLTLYNITYTSLPIFVFGLFEQNISAKTLLENPALYKDIHRNRLLSPKINFLWFLDALWSSSVAFFSFYFLFVNNSNETLNDNLGMLSFGFSLYQCIVVVVSIRLLVQARYWNLALLFSVIITLLFLLCFNLIYHSIHSFMSKQISMYKVIFHVLSSANVWLVTCMCIVAAILPYVLLEYAHNIFLWPNRSDKTRFKVLKKTEQYSNDNVISDSEFVEYGGHTISNRINGISIIGSASAQPNSSALNETQSPPFHNNSLQSDVNVHNPEYGFVNDGYAEDVKEETYL